MFQQNQKAIKNVTLKPNRKESGSNSATEQKMLKNAIISLATELQKLSSEFRQRFEQIYIIIRMHTSMLRVYVANT
jgi:hypothetical protein